MEFEPQHFAELQEKESVHDSLEVMNGPEDGKSFELTKDVVTIGRLPENDFCILLELSVSRKHARLIRKGDEYQLEILPDATNSGQLMEQPIARGETVTVRPGQVFALGNVSIELRKGRAC